MDEHQLDACAKSVRLEKIRRRLVGSAIAPGIATTLHAADNCARGKRRQQCKKGRLNRQTIRTRNRHTLIALGATPGACPPVPNEVALKARFVWSIHAMSASPRPHLDMPCIRRVSSTCALATHWARTTWRKAKSPFTGQEAAARRATRGVTVSDSVRSSALACERT